MPVSCPQIKPTRCSPLLPDLALVTLGRYCALFLFPGWGLDSPAKYLLGCCGACAIPMAIAARRCDVSRRVAFYGCRRDNSVGLQEIGDPSTCGAPFDLSQTAICDCQSVTVLPTKINLFSSHRGHQGQVTQPQTSHTRSSICISNLPSYCPCEGQTASKTACLQQASSWTAAMVRFDMYH